MAKSLFGKRLHDLRLLKKMSQQELADKLNDWAKEHDPSNPSAISKSMISRWENGNTDPQMSYVRLVTKYFGVNPEVFMNESWSLEDDVVDNSVNKNIFTRVNNIVPIYNQLHPARQEKVYNYADDQLKQQQKENVISLDDERQKRQPILLHIAGTVSAGTGEYLPDDDTGDDVSFSGPVPNYDYAVRVNGDSMEPMFEDGQIIFVKRCDDCDIHSGQIVIADLNGDAYVKKIDIQPDGVRLISLNPKYKPILVESFDDFAIQGIVML